MSTVYPFQRYDHESSSASVAGAYRGPLSGADPVDLATPISGLALKATEGRTTLGVSVRFSIVSATVVIIASLFSKGVHLTHTKRTVTADALLKVGALFASEFEPFDLAGCDSYEVRIQLPSSGDVTLFTWEY